MDPATICAGIFTSVIGSFTHSWLGPKLANLHGSELERKLKDIAEKWRKKALKESADREAVKKFVEDLQSPDMVSTEAIQKIRQKLENMEIPSEDEWCDALMDLWDNICSSHRFDGLQEFFRCPRERVRVQFSILAKHFVLAYQANTEYALPALFTGLDAILNAIANIIERKVIPNTWSPTPGEASYRDQAKLTPSWLLHAKNQVVPFESDFRQEELKDLATFCEEERGNTEMIRLYTGPGGIGKTRLMVEHCLNQEEMGWRAFFLTSEFTKENFAEMLSCDCPLFLVIDYAECHPRLGDLLTAVHDNAPRYKHAIRVALLARHAGDWWANLVKEYETKDSGCWAQRPLQPLSDNLESRAKLFQHSAHAFAKILQCSAPESCPLLDAEIYANPLYIQMAAYNALQKSGDSLQNPLEAIVDHEKDFWLTFFEGKLNRVEKRSLKERLERIVAAVTLKGGVTKEELARLVGMFEGYGSQSEIVDLLLNLYTPSDSESTKAVTGLEPDLLGECLVLGVLEREGANAGQFLCDIVESDDEDEITQCFIVLGRLHDQDENSDKVEGWLAVLLDSPLFESLVMPAIRAALTMGERTAKCPIPDMLAKCLKTRGTPALAAEIRSHLPKDSVSFRRLAVWVFQALLEDYRSTKATNQNDEKEAKLLSRYSVALAENGNRESALTESCKAVRLYYDLVHENPDAFHHDFARSLHSLALRFSDLGDREAALKAARKAVRLYRALASQNSEAFNPSLARGLNCLGNMLARLGIHEKALEATQEAVLLSRDLVCRNPKSFKPILAWGLNCLGFRLSNLGDQERALEITREAVQLYRELADRNPDAFSPYLAKSLNNLGAALSNLNDQVDALKSTQEAVEILYGLVHRNPDFFYPELALALNNLGNDLASQGNRDEALEVTQKAVKIRRELASQNPDAFTHDLAKSLINLGTLLSNHGDREGALETAMETKEILRNLARQNPNVFNPDLSLVLNNLGIRLSNLGFREEALETLQEALVIRRKLARKSPQIFKQRLINTLIARKKILVEIEDFEEAEAVQTEIDHLESGESGD